MKKILKYLFFILFGIILYHILDNTINKFNIGVNIVAWKELKPNINRDATNDEDYNYYYLRSADTININDINRIVRDDFPYDTINLVLYPSFNQNQGDTYEGTLQVDEYLFNYYTPDERTRLNNLELTTRQIVDNYEWVRGAPARRSWWQRLCASSSRN